MSYQLLYLAIGMCWCVVLIVIHGTLNGVLDLDKNGMCVFIDVSDREGFEPPVPIQMDTSVFKTDTFNRSDIYPFNELNKVLELCF